MLNSDASLELGPVARTFSPPLRYASAFPVADGPNVLAVVVVFAQQPFEREHRRILENATTLLVSSTSHAILRDVTPKKQRDSIYREQVH